MYTETLKQDRYQMTLSDGKMFYYRNKHLHANAIVLLSQKMVNYYLFYKHDVTYCNTL